jgi:hypothetical protein
MTQFQCNSICPDFFDVPCAFLLMTLFSAMMGSLFMLEFVPKRLPKVANGNHALLGMNSKDDQSEAATSSIAERAYCINFMFDGDNLVILML